MQKTRMPQIAIGLVTLSAFALTATTCVGAAVEKITPAGAADKTSLDEKTIRSQADAFAKSFSQGNASALAEMWLPDGSFIDSDGHEYRGRSEIEKLYSYYFAHNAPEPMTVTIESITFPAPSVAIEVGTTSLPESGTSSKYTAVHLKNGTGQKAQWQMYRVSETPCAPVAPKSSIRDLNWLIGNWTATGSKGKVHVKAKYVGDKRFIAFIFQPDGAAKGTISEVQMLGINPDTRQIIGWSFDGNGGYGRGIWKKEGNDWAIRSMSMQASGKIGTSKNILHKIDDNTFTWSSVNRKFNGVAIPNKSEVKVTRDPAKDTSK